MERTTNKQLQSLVDYINKLTNSPATPYSKGEDGNYHANAGNFHIDAAYGGVQLVRMSNSGGGVSQPLGGGFCTKRELYNKLQAFIRGIEQGQNL